MLDKPTRPKQPNIQERQPPITLQELINRYDLDNLKIYDFLDYLISNLNDRNDDVDNELNSLSSQVSTNTSNISTNSSKIATNTANIATNTSKIATNTTNIATNTTNIATNTAALANIGTWQSYAPSAVSVANNTVTNLTSFTVTKGLYLIVASAAFAANGTGYRQIGIANSSTSSNIDRYSVERVGAVSTSGVTTCIQLTYIREVSANTTLYVNARQNSGSALSTTAGVLVIRLK